MTPISGRRYTNTTHPNPPSTCMIQLSLLPPYSSLILFIFPNLSPSPGPIIGIWILNKEALANEVFHNPREAGPGRLMNIYEVTG